jgi:hypothetical protein
VEPDLSRASGARLSVRILPSTARKARMTGFPTELRPLLALVIVLAIAHMLLKAKARAARAGRSSGARRVKSHARAANLDRLASLAASQPSSSVASVLSPSIPCPVDARPMVGPSTLPVEPAEALAVMRTRADAGRSDPSAGAAR